MVLVYLFLGIAIISDIFMEAIEVITAHTVKKKYVDKDGQERVVEVAVWNPTIANLSLMALGSSAPEILLSVSETILTLGSTPGELGPSTIVGSAAFNLLIITGISIMSVKSPELKKIDDLGVFAITALSSLWAYVWLYICLKIWTPDEITLWEAIITFSFFIVLLVASYAADKLRAWRLKKKGITTDTTPKFSIENFYHILHAKETENDDRTTNHPQHDELMKFLKETFKTDDISGISPE